MSDATPTPAVAAAAKTQQVYRRVLRLGFQSLAPSAPQVLMAELSCGHAQSVLGRRASQLKLRPKVGKRMICAECTRTLRETHEQQLKILWLWGRDNGKV